MKTETKNMRVFPIVEEPEKEYKKLQERNFKFEMPEQNKIIPPGTGDLVSSEELFNLRQSIVELANKYGFSSINSAQKTENLNKIFDRKFAELLFTKMNITPSVAATLPMWYFVNIILVPDVLYWRWGDSPERYYSQTRRVYSSRAWWTYYLFSDSEEYKRKFEAITEKLLSDLFERTNSHGLSHNIANIAIWFDELTKNTLLKETEKQTVFRKTLILYNAKLSYINYYALTDDKRKEIFRNCFEKAKV